MLFDFDAMLSEIMQNYAAILIFIGVSLFLSLFLLVIPFVLNRVANSSKNISAIDNSQQKLSTYECGFEPVGDSRGKFNVRFYLVAILFLIFDVEIIFLVPWILSVKSLGIMGYLAVMLFLFILTVGFIYEWKKGALEWD